MGFKAQFRKLLLSKGERGQPVSDDPHGGIKMNLRKLVVALTITAFAAIGSLSFSGIDAGAEFLAGPSSWLTDNDVG